MPITSEVDVTDNLVLIFGKILKVTLLNKGASAIRVKKIGSSLDFVKAINFDENDAVIELGCKKTYLFEAEYVPQTASNEGKIRFTFGNRTHVTRSIRTAHDDLDSDVEAQTEPEIRKIQSVQKLSNVSTPSMGIFKISEIFFDEDWAEHFYQTLPNAVDISDDLNIEFDRSQESKSCQVVIYNNTFKKMYLDSIKVNLPSITSCNFNGKKAKIIEPGNKLQLRFEATFDPNKLKAQARVGFNFRKMAMMWRTIKIQYRKKGPVIPKSLYDIPMELNDLIHSETKIPRSVLLDALDVWVPSLQQNYAKHFHNLLYLEEINLRREIKEKYNQNEAYFCDQEYWIENGRKMRKKYNKGVYDLTVKDLYQTRPSLQQSDKIIARKRSNPTVEYEGDIIEIKEDDDLVIVQFKEDFVNTFDQTAYVVEFVFARSSYVRMHFAIDLAIDIFGIDYLIPMEALEREKPIIDVHLNKYEQLELLPDKKVLKWFNKSLNDHQKQTVANVMRGDFLNPYLIYGPPGTGKTTTLTEIILQIVSNIEECKILVCTQSNSAANLLAQRLNQLNLLDSDSLLRIISYKYANKSNTIPDDIQSFVRTIEELQPIKDSSYYVRLEQVKKYQIVIGTYSTIGQLLEANSLRNNFTHAIVEEAGQCTEIGVLIPMVLVGKSGQTIMAGDPMQMPPLVFNMHSNARGLNISMLSRLLECYPNLKYPVCKSEQSFDSRLVSKLLRNYRSLPSILDYYNTEFYHSELIPMIHATESREAKLLKHLSVIFKGLDFSIEHGIYFINVEGRDEKRETSRFNISEANIITSLVEKIIRLGLSKADIGVITPYSLQVRAIKSNLDHHPEVKVGTVEDFQGLERKVVLISTVRTCSNGVTIDVSRQLGFVKCPKRLNVSISRSRAMVIVVGKARLLQTDVHWNALIENCKANKAIKYIEKNGEL